MRTATCNGPNCGAQIVWCKTRKGKNMPLDVEPNPEGDWLIEGEDDEKPLAVRIAPDAEYTGPRYMAHWGTCPDREGFRRQKAGA